MIDATGREAAGPNVETAIAPTLAGLGFDFDKPNIAFRRSINREQRRFIQIIEFQIGTKALTGRFTVNLGVYCPALCDMQPVSSTPWVSECLSDMTPRLGRLFDPPQSPTARLLRFSERPPTDYWWKRDDDVKRIRATLLDVRD